MDVQAAGTELTVTPRVPGMETGTFQDPSEGGDVLLVKGTLEKARYKS